MESRYEHVHACTVHVSIIMVEERMSSHDINKLGMSIQTNSSIITLIIESYR